MVSTDRRVQLHQSTYCEKDPKLKCHPVLLIYLLDLTLPFHIDSTYE